ncbi:hypothetical protein H2200_007722 [Cladophialophora chaetospira]|uniref:VOC domain-containing protein n=1 Tax=Cladophialophora chaetospira TaxID=386627 RepID=A0AA38X6D0_9EURO|nr:hypothetical protein H2200_007722 [Cladophialophora chaetospira]
MGSPSLDSPGSKVLPPAYLAHVVLRTNKLQAMSSFYQKFLGATVTYENDRASFLRFDQEHHRIALLGIPGTADKNPKSCGLEHIAFTYRTLTDLALSYLQRKQNGFEPYFCVNHGPTTSIYYHDPDGNQLETQVDNFDTLEEATAFVDSPEFAANPVGTDFDPEELVRRIQSGEDDKLIKKRVESGPKEIFSFD